MKTVRVGRIEYVANAEGEEVVLSSESVSGTPRSNPKLSVVMDDDVHLVEFGDNWSSFPFDEEAAYEFVEIMQPILDAHCAAAREAGRREERAKIHDSLRCKAIDNFGYGCCKTEDHPPPHQRCAHIDGVPMPVDTDGKV